MNGYEVWFPTLFDDIVIQGVSKGSQRKEKAGVVVMCKNEGERFSDCDDKYGSRRGTNVDAPVVSPVLWDVRKLSAPCEGDAVEPKEGRGVGGKVNSRSW